MTRQPERTHDVFISYSRKDKKVAEAICAKLEESKIRCWIDYRDIPPGEKWAAYLISAIKRSPIMVLVFSKESNASEQVERELAAAFNNGVKIIPFKITDGDPTGDFEFYLSNTNWLDAITEPMEQHILRLRSDVSRMLNINIPDDRETDAHKTNNVDSSGIRKIKSRAGKSRITFLTTIALAAAMVLAVLAGMTWWPKQKFNDSNFSALYDQAKEKYSSGQGREAEELLARVTKMGENHVKGESPSWEWNTYVAEPWNYRASNAGWLLQDHRLAKEFFQKSIDAARKADSAGLNMLTSSLLGLAIMEGKLGEEENFEEFIKQALDIAHKMGESGVGRVAEVHAYWATYLAEKSMINDAREHYHTALSLFENLIQTKPDDDWSKIRKNEVLREAQRFGISEFNTNSGESSSTTHQSSSNPAPSLARRIQHRIQLKETLESTRNKLDSGVSDEQLAGGLLVDLENKVSEFDAVFEGADTDEQCEAAQRIFFIGDMLVQKYSNARAFGWRLVDKADSVISNLTCSEAMLWTKWWIFQGKAYLLHWYPSSGDTLDKAEYYFNKALSELQSPAANKNPVIRIYTVHSRVQRAHFYQEKAHDFAKAKTEIDDALRICKESAALQEENPGFKGWCDLANQRATTINS